MSRPRRAAVLNRKKPEDLELSEESDDGDFSSGDSDDYDPEKSKTNHAETETDDEEIESEEESTEVSESSPEKDPRKSISKRGFVSTLRGKPSNNFLKAKGRDTSLTSLKEILAKAQYQKRKINSQEDPQFDCSGGLKLSDSEDDDDENEEAASQKSSKPFKSNNLIDSINEGSKNSLADLKKLHDNYQDYERAKEKMKTYKKSSQNGVASQKENLNIADLLAMGEQAEKPLSQKRNRADESDSDDAWEDVEGDQPSRKESKESVEVVINPFLQAHKEKAKEVDLEAQMKRKFNRRLKEIQVHLHKTNLLAWIAHGNFVNKKMNDTNLMKTALEMLPKNRKQCYPAGKTDISYFKQITNWFKSTVSLNNKSMYCNLKKRPQILTSLALQMKFKAAISRRDYTLMYVALLRAIGIQCRIVQSFVCHPILPPKEQLLSLSKKTDEKSSKSSSKSKPKSSSSKKTSQSSKKSQKSSSTSSKSSRSKSKSQPKIPQLDGADDEPRKTRRNVRIKGSSSFHVEETFVDLDKKDSPDVQKIETAKTKIATRSKKVSLPPSSTNSPSSSQKSAKTQSKSMSQVDKTKEDVIFSPRRLRSRSKSVDQPPIQAKKVNLKKLAEKRPAVDDKATTNGTKKAKIDEKPESKKPNLKKLKDEMENGSENSKSLQKRKSEPAKVEAVKPKKSRVSFKSICDDEDSDSSAKLFKPSTSSTSKNAKNTKKILDRRVLSSEDEVDTKSAPSSPTKQSKGIDIWVEVYSEVDERWIAIDVFRNKVDNVKEITKSATHPLVYVFAFNNDNSIKDVSARYCPNLNTTIRKMRVDTAYLSSVLSMFAAPRTSRDFKENEELNEILYAHEKPKAISDFKNHPLYALRRHLLKYEALYPPEPPILGYIRDEAIYPRDCVYVLHTRETWLKEARTVKLNEEPYKITKTFKWDKATNKLLKDIPQELFGRWQTQDYEPPVAENGMVPRNAYGNVELFKPCMLPIGTVHLQLPGLNRICKKLNIDCAQAVVGFDSNGGWPFPVYDGFIVCQEFEEKVLDAWNRDRDEQEKKEQEKYEKRVYGNWKKIIKGLLIRQRLKNKYNFDSLA